MTRPSSGAASGRFLKKKKKKKGYNNTERVTCKPRSCRPSLAVDTRIGNLLSRDTFIRDRKRVERWEIIKVAYKDKSEEWKTHDWGRSEAEPDGQIGLTRVAAR